MNKKADLLYGIILLIVAVFLINYFADSFMGINLASKTNSFMQKFTDEIVVVEEDCDELKGVGGIWENMATLNMDIECDKICRKEFDFEFDSRIKKNTCENNELKCYCYNML